MPTKLRRDLPEFFIHTVQEEGWAGLENGALLKRAVEHFDVLLTVDQRLRYQQNVSSFAIGIVVIETGDTTVGNLQRVLPEIRSAIDTVMRGNVRVVAIP